MAGSITIGAMRYDIIADTSKFEKTVVATKQETRDMKRVFRETQTPAQKYGAAIEKLNSLRRKGLITSKQYRAALAKESTAYKTATVGAAGLTAKYGAMGTALQGLMAPLAGIATLGGVTSIIGAQLGAVDEIAKASRELGLYTDELIGFRLAAAEMSGLASGVVDSALEKMQQRLSEAAQGTGEATDALKELKLSTSALMTAGPAAAFREIADAIKEVPNEADQLRLTIDIFGRSAGALVNTLDAGSDGLEQMQKRAEELGLTFSEETKADIEETNDAITEMKAAFTGVARTITGLVAPAITDLSNSITGFIDDFREIQSNVRENTLSLFGGRTLGGDPAIAARQRRDAARAADRARKEEEAFQKRFKDAQEHNIKRNAEIEEEKRLEVQQKLFENEKLAVSSAADLQRKVNQENRDAARAEIANLNEQLRGIKTPGAINLGQVGAGGSGSLSEYQFLRDRQKQEQQARLRNKAEEEAKAARDKLNTEIERQTGILEDIKNNTEANQTVGV